MRHILISLAVPNPVERLVSFFDLNNEHSDYEALLLLIFAPRRSTPASAANAIRDPTRLDPTES